MEGRPGGERGLEGGGRRGGQRRPQATRTGRGKSGDLSAAQKSMTVAGTLLLCLRFFRFRLGRRLSLGDRLGGFQFVRFGGLRFLAVSRFAEGLLDHGAVFLRHGMKLRPPLAEQGRERLQPANRF